MTDTLVIGDCHGHYDRLTALLEQEGLISPEGDRLRPEVTVIQLGDIGHHGMDRGIHPSAPPQEKSPTADRMCYELVRDGLIDTLLWGNHDRAVFYSNHQFGGYVRPPHVTKHIMEEIRAEGRYLLAVEAHGFLLTHAGLHKSFKYNRVPDEYKTDPAVFATALNDADAQEFQECPTDFMAIVDAISSRRGGRSPAGGILWRDAAESLYPNFRQIFGHTAKDGKVRKYQTPNGLSYCIDIGTPHNRKLAGMWLPSEKIVEVKCT